MRIINSAGKKFHSILAIHPNDDNTYSFKLDYRNILIGKYDVTFYPIIVGQDLEKEQNAIISEINLNDVNDIDVAKQEVIKYLQDILDKVKVHKSLGVQRFYDNTTKFLVFP